jgi:inner membrane protein involved in colicin E2 resistance
MEVDATWFGEYASAYVQSTLAGSPNAPGFTCPRAVMPGRFYQVLQHFKSALLL